MLRRQRGGSGLPMAHGGGNNSGSGGYYGSQSSNEYNNNNRGYGGYSNSYSSTTRTSGSLRSNSSLRNQQSFSNNPILLLRIGIAISVLWSVIFGGRYWSLRRQLKEVTKHIPEANPWNSEIRRNLPSVIENYMQRLQTKVDTSQRNVQQRQRDQRRQFQQQINDLERSNRFLQKESDELRVKYEGPDKVEELARLQLREEAYQDQVDLLQKATRKESKRAVIERFGAGPHFVQMMFEARWGRDGSMVQNEFVIQLAPLDTVPHAIHLFLEQVQHGLWNQSASFYINGPHVLQCGPDLEEEEEDEENESVEDAEADASSGEGEKRHNFVQRGLDSLAFPDYSPDFPHVAWTVGYAGRPGGPDFYINKVDNTHAHGPGGQVQHALHEEGDACFGRIVKGQMGLGRVFSSPTYSDGSDWNYVMRDAVHILGAVILNVEDPSSFLSSSESSTNSSNREDSPDSKWEEKPQKIKELKRRPRLPKIEQAVEP